MANSLDESEMTFAEALIRYRLTGVPIPAHLKHRMNGPIKGTDKPRADRLADRFQWGKPWYRSGGRAHSGNSNPMHGRSPGVIDHRSVGELTKADINQTEAL